MNEERTGKCCQCRWIGKKMHLFLLKISNKNLLKEFRWRKTPTFYILYLYIYLLFFQGYVPRQALYSCITCNTSDPSAVCLACSYECHEGHDLIELYTKRNFKCDCGNGKFKDLSCKLFQKKAGHNEDNRYNHNFTGLYCICNRPYPDHDDDVSFKFKSCF